RHHRREVVEYGDDRLQVGDIVRRLHRPAALRTGPERERTGIMSAPERERVLEKRWGPSSEWPVARQALPAGCCGVRLPGGGASPGAPSSATCSNARPKRCARSNRSATSVQFQTFQTASKNFAFSFW